MPYEFGDVILVRFPFTNQADFKQRPAVVVSSRAYNWERRDVILMAITSQLRDADSSGALVIVEWKAAHLLKQSLIKPVFATIEQALIVKALGKLQPSDVSALKKVIAELLA